MHIQELLKEQHPSKPLLSKLEQWHLLQMHRKNNDQSVTKKGLAGIKSIQIVSGTIDNVELS